MDWSARLSDIFLCFRTGIPSVSGAEPFICFCMVLIPGPERTTHMLSRLTRQVVEFVRREDGPTAVEYAVMLALIIVVCITAITAIGTNANAKFATVATTLAS